MKPIACTADKNDITVLRSSSREAAEQYDRMTATFATKIIQIFGSQLSSVLRNLT